MADYVTPSPKTNRRGGGGASEKGADREALLSALEALVETASPDVPGRSPTTSGSRGGPLAERTPAKHSAAPLGGFSPSPQRPTPTARPSATAGLSRQSAPPPAAPSKVVRSPFTLKRAASQPVAARITPSTSSSPSFTVSYANRALLAATDPPRPAAPRHYSATDTEPSALLFRSPAAAAAATTSRTRQRTSRSLQREVDKALHADGDEPDADADGDTEKRGPTDEDMETDAAYYDMDGRASVTASSSGSSTDSEDTADESHPATGSRQRLFTEAEVQSRLAEYEQQRDEEEERVLRQVGMEVEQQRRELAAALAERDAAVSENAELREKLADVIEQCERLREAARELRAERQQRQDAMGRLETQLRHARDGSRALNEQLQKQRQEQEQQQQQQQQQASASSCPPAASGPCGRCPALQEEAEQWRTIAEERQAELAALETQLQRKESEAASFQETYAAECAAIKEKMTFFGNCMAGMEQTLLRKDEAIAQLKRRAAEETAKAKAAALAEQQKTARVAELEAALQHRADEERHRLGRTLSLERERNAASAALEKARTALETACQQQENFGDALDGVLDRLHRETRRISTSAARTDSPASGRSSGPSAEDETLIYEDGDGGGSEDGGEEGGTTAHSRRPASPQPRAARSRSDTSAVRAGRTASSPGRAPATRSAPPPGTRAAPAPTGGKKRDGAGSAPLSATIAALRSCSAENTRKLSSVQSRVAALAATLRAAHCADSPASTGMTSEGHARGAAAAVALSRLQRAEEACVYLQEELRRSVAHQEALREECAAREADLAEVEAYARQLHARLSAAELAAAEAESRAEAERAAAEAESAEVAAALREELKTARAECLQLQERNTALLEAEAKANEHAEAARRSEARQKKQAEAMEKMRQEAEAAAGETEALKKKQKELYEQLQNLRAARATAVTKRKPANGSAETTGAAAGTLVQLREALAGAKAMNAALQAEAEQERARRLAQQQQAARLRQALETLAGEARLRASAELATLRAALSVIGADDAGVAAAQVDDALGNAAAPDPDLFDWEGRQGDGAEVLEVQLLPSVGAAAGVATAPPQPPAVSLAALRERLVSGVQTIVLELARARAGAGIMGAGSAPAHRGNALGALSKSATKAPRYGFDHVPQSAELNSFREAESEARRRAAEGGLGGGTPHHNESAREEEEIFIDPIIRVGSSGSRRLHRSTARPALADPTATPTTGAAAATVRPLFSRSGTASSHLASPDAKDPFGRSGSSGSNNGVYTLSAKGGRLGSLSPGGPQSRAGLTASRSLASGGGGGGGIDGSGTPARPPMLRASSAH